MIYHNSRQELGKTTTMLLDDVRSRLEVLQPVENIRRTFENILELSANLKGAEVTEALDNLSIEWPVLDSIDALACTNMISVGVDVGRLGLMIVKGQPKNTSEYIQATSRVGRDISNRPPGIVLTLYASTRPRDRSHFEGFQSYHQSLYRLVEPTTVTPFSPRSLDRSLHASLIATVRHCLGLEGSGEAGTFDPADETTNQLLNKFKTRILAAAEDEDKEELSNRIREIIQAWSKEAKDHPQLRFKDEKQHKGIIKEYDHGGKEDSLLLGPL